MPDVYFSPVINLCCSLFVVAVGKLFNDSESGDLLLLFITKSKKNACHSGARGQLEGTRSMQNYGFKGKKTL